jgi:aspartyl-tRNA(Asn)/glutamyl-tRNA(Gln) amidotransferase subunit B
MYKPTIGLEIHCELNTKSKMFCSCKNDPSDPRPNVNICEVCTAQPGTLPVANEEAVKKVIKAGLALHCQIATESKFDRKNYFYPDIPKGYQISQYDQPLCAGGFLEINGRNIGITRIHLEEDTGSSVHPDGADLPTGQAGYSLVNYNRAGAPLMELVTEPDITSGQEAKKFAEELQLIFKYLGVSDADMEKGLMRVEVNISVSKTKKFGTKVEIKNLNSFRVVQKAIDFEIARQTELLESGEVVVQETRGWNDKKEITFSQREKESAHDYRYFPEPDLPALHFTQEYINEIRSQITELPAQKRVRFAQEFGLGEDQIEIFVGQKDLSEYFEKVISELDEMIEGDSVKAYKLAANYLVSDLQGILAGKEFVEKDCKITPENFAEFIAMIYANKINSKTAKALLVEMFNTGSDPSMIVEENNWGQMTDSGELEKVVKTIIDKNPKAIADYKSGNQNAIQFLSGQVMKETRGTADPQKVQEILRKMM